MDTTTQTQPGQAGAGPDRLTSYRMAGVSGLIWAAMLVWTNVVNGAVSPAVDADVAEVAAHLVDDRVAIGAITLGFVVGVPFVVLFMTGMYRRLRDGGMGAAGLVGLFGFSVVGALFAMVAATRLSLVAALESGAVGPDAVWAMWKLHNVVFGFNAAFLSIAYLGFAVGAVGVGLVHRAFGMIAPVGALLLFAGALATQLTAEGGIAGMALGGLGFLTWLIFVIAAAIGLTRAEG